MARCGVFERFWREGLLEYERLKGVLPVKLLDFADHPCYLHLH